MHLSQVIDGFFIVRRIRLAPTTQTNYRYCFKRLTNFLGPERDFASITASDIRAFIDHLQNDELSDRSVHDNLAICSALWTFAESEFKLPHVVKEVERPDYNKKEIIPYTQDEIKAIMDVAEWAAQWDTRLGKHVRSKRSTWRRDLAIIVLLLDRYVSSATSMNTPLPMQRAAVAEANHQQKRISLDHICVLGDMVIGSLHQTTSIIGVQSDVASSVPADK